MNAKTLSIMMSAVLAGSVAFAAPAVESFEQFAGAHAGQSGETGFDGASSATTFPWAPGATPSGGNFGGTPITIETADPFDGSQYLRWDASSDAWSVMAGEAAYAEILPGTDGEVFAAFAMRLPSADATAANNNVDIFRLGQGAGGLDIIIFAVDGDLVLDSRNGMPADVVLSAAGVTQGGAFVGSTWRVLAVHASYDTVGTTSFVRVWEVPETGSATLLGESTGFTATADTGITNYGFGAFVGVPPSPNTNTVVEMDAVHVWPSADFADETAFLSGVQSTLWGTPANVNNWMTFE
jgi:hypothetical protein